jgi:Ca2+-binding EF-hand superfamily protein
MVSDWKWAIATVSIFIKNVVNDSIPGQDHLSAETFQKLLLTESEVDKFYTAFCDIDADSSGFIRGDEFRAYFKIEKTSFNNKIFVSFDSDGNGYLNFMEFVCSV